MMRAIQAVCLAAFSTGIAWAQAQPQYFGVGGSGYLSTSMNTLFPGFQHGATWYSMSWPITARPLADFQIGFAGTWMKPNNFGYTQLLCPPGTPARDSWWDGRGNLGDLFQTIEGGLGTWGSLRFPTSNPKFKVNGTGDCYSTGQDALGWGWQVPSFGCDRLGIGQLSNRLLIPPDALIVPADANGVLLGYGYLALPLFPARGPADGIRTGDQTWTLFLNSTNFKGPSAFWVPDFWSELYQKHPSIVGRGLDANSAFMGGVAAEFGFFPRFRAVTADNTAFSRYPVMRFPVDSRNRTVLLQDIRLYSDEAVFQRVKRWMNGGDAAAPEFPAQGQREPTCDTRTTSAGLRSMGGTNDEVPLMLDDVVKTIGGRSVATSSTCAFGLQWTPTANFPAGALPEYYRRPAGATSWTPVPARDVPTSTRLQEQNFREPRQAPPFTLTPAPASACWIQPGPAAGPFAVDLSDGSTVTYYWYRFIDQPALQRMKLTEEDKARVQAFVETMHRTWRPTDNYMAPPTSGTLGAVEEALLVMPPAGLEAGYVPIVVDQRRRAAPGTGLTVPNPPQVVAPGSQVVINGTGLAERVESSAQPAVDLGGASVLLGEIPIPLLLASPSALRLYIPESAPPGQNRITLSVAGRTLAWDVEVRPVAATIHPDASALTIPGVTPPATLQNCVFQNCAPSTVPLWDGDTEPALLTLTGSGFRGAAPETLRVRIGWTEFPVESVEAVNSLGLDRLTVRIPTPPAQGAVEAAVFENNVAPISSTPIQFESRTATQQVLGSTRAITADRHGNVYWGDQPGRRVRMLTPLGQVSTVFETADASIRGLAVDSQGALYISSGDRVLQVPAGGGAARVLVSTGLSGPFGLALDEAKGQLYVAENGGARIRRVDVTTGALTTIAGTGRRGTASGDGLPALQVDLGSPVSIALGPDGAVYFTDDNAQRIRKIGLDGLLQNVAGTGTGAKSPDGATAATSPVATPRGISVDARGTIRFTELAPGSVRIIDAEGKLQTIVRDLIDPFASTLDPYGYLYVLDIGRRRLTRFTPGGLIPSVLATE